MEKVTELYIDQECDGSGCGWRLIAVTDKGNTYASQKVFKVRKGSGIRMDAKTGKMKIAPLYSPIPKVKDEQSYEEWCQSQPKPEDE